MSTEIHKTSYLVASYGSVRNITHSLRYSMVYILQMFCLTIAIDTVQIALDDNYIDMSLQQQNTILTS